MKHTVYNSARAVVSLTPAARSANTAVNGTAVDRTEFKNYARTVGVVVVTGAITDGTHAITLEVSDDNSNWSAAQTAYLQGSLPSIGASDDGVIREFGYTGPERYVRVTATTSGATSGGIFSAVVLLGDVRRLPVARS